MTRRVWYWLVVCLLVAEAAVWALGNRVVNRVAGGAAGISLLADTLTGLDHGWSVARLLSTNYTGAAVRVRRSSDDAEQDIGFASTSVDRAAMEAFCSGTDGFLVTIYDQIGASNLTQNTASDQPQIVSAGTALENADGYLAATFDGTSDEIPTPNLEPPFTMVTYSEMDDAFANNDRGWGWGSGRDDWRWRTSLVELIEPSYAGSLIALDMGQVAGDTPHMIMQWRLVDGSVGARLNDGTEQTDTGGNTGVETSGVLGNVNQGGSLNSPLRFTERILFNEDATSQESVWQEDMNAWYGIW